MTPIGRPSFEVIVGATAEERRLISAETVRGLTGLEEGDVTDETLNLQIEVALAQCATNCKLARAGSTPLTLAQEAVRATWLAASWTWPTDRMRYGVEWLQPSQLLLPWRAPISTIAITEGETELEENTDFRLLGAGVVERIGACWSTGSSIVVDYTAGWVPLAADPAYQADGEPMPADLVARIVDQVALALDQQGVDKTLRSENSPGLWSGSYNVPGGDMIAASGLLRPLEEALVPYRAPATFA